MQPRETALYSDHELLERIQQGDVMAFEMVYTKYASPLYSAAYGLLKDKEECEDIIQELFTYLWVKRHRLAIRDLRSYLFNAVKNNVLMAIRSGKVRVTIEFLEKQAAHLQADDKIMEKDLRQQIADEVALLPKKCREIFSLSRYEQLTHKEIAEKLNISVKTVENQITIALNRLRISLKDFLPIIALLLLFFSV